MNLIQYYLGIDLHKRTSYVTLMDQEGKVKLKKNLKNEEIKEWIRENVAYETKGVVEATGNWSYLQEELEGEIAELVVAHPYKLKAISTSVAKTDKLDSRILADLARLNYLPESYAAPLKIRELREIVRYREYLVRQKTRYKNRVHAILSRRNLNAPVKDIFGVRGQKYIKENLGELNRSSQVVIQSQLVEIKRLEAKVAGIEKKWKQLLTAKQNKILTIIKTVPGIGEVNGMLALAEIGNIERFGSARALTNWAGIVPRVHQSSGTLYHGRISKKGSRYLRLAFTRAASSAVNKSPRLKRIYEQHLKTLSKTGAKVVIARKLAVIVYHVWKKEEPYQENYRSAKSQKNSVELVI